MSREPFTYSWWERIISCSRVFHGLESEKSKPCVHPSSIENSFMSPTLTIFWDLSLMNRKRISESNSFFTTIREIKWCPSQKKSKNVMPTRKVIRRSNQISSSFKNSTRFTQKMVDIREVFYNLIWDDTIKRRIFVWPRIFVCYKAHHMNSLFLCFLWFFWYYLYAIYFFCFCTLRIFQCFFTIPTADIEKRMKWSEFIQCIIHISIIEFHGFSIERCEVFFQHAEERE